MLIQLELLKLLFQIKIYNFQTSLLQFFYDLKTNSKYSEFNALHFVKSIFKALK
jgi:hypothetical protein